ncbi:MAG TPA: hypothetical protein VMU66_10040 [Gaiellales bacterium]|nr:hypothetical protein [Gaiellales bacterium]
MERYAVVWSESGGPRFVGSLTVDDDGLHLDGSAGEELSQRDLRLDEIVRVRIERVPGADDDVVRHVLLERRDATPLQIDALDGAGTAFEIADQVAAAGGRGGTATSVLVVVVPIWRRRREQARQLVQEGPPFDPGSLGELERHHVFVGTNQVIFVFEGRDVREAIDQLLHTAGVWTAAAAWRECISGRPSLLEAEYSWKRPAGARAV